MKKHAPTGVCGAATRAGGVCKARPVKGHHRCALHGGRERSTGVKPSSGWSTTYRHLGEQGLQVLAETVAQPDLLDGRRVVATIQMVLNQIAFPSEALVLRKAQRIARERVREEGGDALKAEPDEVDHEEALRALLDGSVKRFERLAAQIQAAMRTARVEALFAEVVTPALTDISTIMADVIREHIANPAHRELAMSDLSRKLTVWVARMNMAATAAENE